MIEIKIDLYLDDNIKKTEMIVQELKCFAMVNNLKLNLTILVTKEQINESLKELIKNKEYEFNYKDVTFFGEKIKVIKG